MQVGKQICCNFEEVRVLVLFVQSACDCGRRRISQCSYHGGEFVILPNGGLHKDNLYHNDFDCP